MTGTPNVDACIPPEPQRMGDPQVPALLAQERLPAAQSSVQADAVLSEILGVAADLPLDANSRGVLDTLAAALLMCPDDVSLTLDVSNLPPFLRPDGYRDANEAPLTEADVLTRQRRCGTCDMAFVAPQKTIFIRYQDLVGQLVMGHDPSTRRWQGWVDRSV
jgi:hypothetical protein